MSEVEIRTEIAIAAPPPVVWSVLADFEGFAAWNPMVTRARGSATAGSIATLRYRSSVGVPLCFRVRITRAEVGRELRWLGSRLGVSGEHYFRLLADGDHTHLVHGEVFRGLIAGPLRRLFQAQIPVFASFDRALKREAERRAGAATGDRAPGPQ